MSGLFLLGFFSLGLFSRRPFSNLLNNLVELLLLLGEVQGVAQAVAPSLPDSDSQTNLKRDIFIKHVLNAIFVLQIEARFARTNFLCHSEKSQSANMLPLASDN